MKNLMMLMLLLIGLKQMSEELICPWCLDNTKSCSACDDSYEGE